MKKRRFHYKSYNENTEKAPDFKHLIKHYVISLNECKDKKRFIETSIIKCNFQAPFQPGGVLNRCQFL